MVLVALSLIAGFFAGLSLCLGYVVFVYHGDKTALNAERMVLTNKLFVRNGETPIYNPAMILGKEIPRTPPPASIQSSSPFQNGLKHARDKVEDGIKVDAGAKIPDELKPSLAAGIERLKNREATA